MSKFLKLIGFFLMICVYFNEAQASVYYYRCREGDRVHNIFRAYYQSTFSGNEIVELEIDINKFAKALFEVNPQIKDWTNLKKDTIIIVPAFNFKKPKLSMGLFYTASQGDFSEVLKSSGATVNSTQVSPVTLGFMSQYQFGGTNYSLANSFYISKLNSSSVTRTLESDLPKLTIPIEIGGNLYWQYALKTLPLTPYAGVDFERMTTFNVTELQNATPLETRQNTLIYSTFGLSYNFNLGSVRFHFKGAFSNSLFSSSSSSNPDDKFVGSRRIFYLNAKLDGPWVLHMFHKHHDLVGPTKLTINRIGVGFGYFFF